MKIWIHLDGKQEGPYTIDELPLERMTAETPVWYEGLANWTKAGEAPATASLFSDTIEVKETFIEDTAEKNDSPEEKDASAPERNASPGQALYDENLRRIEPNAHKDEPRGATAGNATDRGASSRGWGFDYTSQSEKQKCPPTYFAWSILMTLICCNPIGIVPILTGYSTRSRWRNQNFSGARKMSNITEWWIMITIVTSLMFLPLIAVIQN